MNIPFMIGSFIFIPKIISYVALIGLMIAGIIIDFNIFSSVFDKPMLNLKTDLNINITIFPKILKPF